MSFEILNSKDHASLRINTQARAEFGDQVMQCITFPFEFRNIQAWYPIFFQTDRDSNLYPLALFGFEEGENLFLQEPDWKAGYVPAMMRREPFLIGVKEGQDAAGEIHQARVLSIDVEHPRVSQEEGESLFNPLGDRTDYLEEQANLLETLHDGLSHCQAFTQTLQEYELIEDVTLDIRLNDGTHNQMIGLSAVNEDAVRELTGDQLEKLSKEGFLMPLYMAIASMSNVQRLIELKNDRVAAA